MYFIHGTKDVHVFGSQVQKYFDILDARKGKYLIWEDKSSHMFHPDDARDIEKTLVDIAKKLNDDNKKNEDQTKTRL